MVKSGERENSKAKDILKGGGGGGGEERNSSKAKDILKGLKRKSWESSHWKADNKKDDHRSRKEGGVGGGGGGGGGGEEGEREDFCGRRNLVLALSQSPKMCSS